MPGTSETVRTHHQTYHVPYFQKFEDHEVSTTTSLPASNDLQIKNEDIKKFIN